jgi:hypothetical protein
MFEDDASWLNEHRSLADPTDLALLHTSVIIADSKITEESMRKSVDHSRCIFPKDIFSNKVNHIYQRSNDDAIMDGSVDIFDRRVTLGHQSLSSSSLLDQHHRDLIRQSQMVHLHTELPPNEQGHEKQMETETIELKETKNPVSEPEIQPQTTRKQQKEQKQKQVNELNIRAIFEDDNIRNKHVQARERSLALARGESHIQDKEQGNLQFAQPVENIIPSQPPPRQIVVEQKKIPARQVSNKLELQLEVYRQKLMVFEPDYKIDRIMKMMTNTNTDEEELLYWETLEKIRENIQKREPVDREITEITVHYGKMLQELKKKRKTSKHLEAEEANILQIYNETIKAMRNSSLEKTKKKSIPIPTTSIVSKLQSKAANVVPSSMLKNKPNVVPQDPLPPLLHSNLPRQPSPVLLSSSPSSTNTVETLSPPYSLLPQTTLLPLDSKFPVLISNEDVKKFENHHYASREFDPFRINNNDMIPSPHRQFSTPDVFTNIKELRSNYSVVWYHHSTIRGLVCACSIPTIDVYQRKPDHSTTSLLTSRLSSLSSLSSSSPITTFEFEKPKIRDPQYGIYNKIYLVDELPQDFKLPESKFDLLGTWCTDKTQEFTMLGIDNAVKWVQLSDILSLLPREISNTFHRIHTATNLSEIITSTVLSSSAIVELSNSIIKMKRFQPSSLSKFLGRPRVSWFRQWKVTHILPNRGYWTVIEKYATIYGTHRVAHIARGSVVDQKATSVKEPTTIIDIHETAYEATLTEYHTRIDNCQFYLFGDLITDKTTKKLPTGFTICASLSPNICLSPITSSKLKKILPTPISTTNIIATKV